MSAPCRSTRFPERILDIAQYIQKRKDPLIIPIGDEAKARKFRREIYGYRSVMEKEGMIDIYPRFIACEIRVDKDGNLIIQAKDDTDFWVIAGKALDDAGMKQ